MKALVFSAPRTYSIEEVPDPVIRSDEVLCEVNAVSICGTDRHIFEGDMLGKWPKSYPFIPGHEWSGAIVEMGTIAEELGFGVGELVAGTSHAGCGYCRMCRTGRYTLCENYGKEPLHHQYGHYSQGACADLIAVSVRSVFRLPVEVDPFVVPLLDPASIALHAVKRSRLQPGETVVVIGAGPLGALAAECAQALGAGKVVVTGSGQRLERVQNLGFEVINRSLADPVLEVKDMTDHVDVAIDTAGTALSASQAVSMLTKGGRAVFLGFPPDPVGMPISRLALEELELIGVRANPNTMEEVIPLVVSGRVRLRELITHTYDLAEFGEAMETFINRKDGALKVLLKLSP